jgi:cytochrome c
MRKTSVFRSIRLAEKECTMVLEMTRLAAIGLGVLCTAVAAAALAADSKKGPVSAVQADGPRFREPPGKLPPERGQQLYIEHCALCHGMTGRGDGPRSAYFQPGVQFIPDFASPGYLTGRDAQVMQSIREGLTRLPEPAIVMPQFKYILSDAEIRGVLAYAQSLARQADKGAGPARTAVATADGEALAKQYNCLVCHQAGSKVVGPSYRDVAAKYRGQPGAAAMLAAKIRKGSSGVWGEVPMPPKPDMPDADLQRLVDWILKLG